MKNIDIWNGEAPYGGTRVEMHCYEPKIKRGDGAVVIFPGGGYSFRAPHEGDGYAEKLSEIGVTAFVVDYRVAPSRFPAPLADARRAILTVRERAKEFCIDPRKIAVMGSSAGGHLAALSATYKSEEGLDDLPNAQILCYPVTDIESHRGSYENLLGERLLKFDSVTPTLLASEGTPPAFIWHTSSDDLVDVRGSYQYAARLSELSVPVEMHIYPVGGHGLGLADGISGRAKEEYVQRWIDDLEHWLKLMKWINE